MQRLNRGMLRRYDIPEHAPTEITLAQFGLGEALLGVADRLLDAACPHIGIACVAPDAPWDGEGANPAALLREQEGLFTLLARGYRGETPVKSVRLNAEFSEKKNYHKVSDLPALFSRQEIYQSNCFRRKRSMTYLPPATCLNSILTLMLSRHV